MAIGIHIKLTSLGNGHGEHFDLYSDVDGFTQPYETMITKAELLAGYNSSAPNNTVIVRVQGINNSNCKNFIDITPNYTTTTTTSSTTTTTTTTAAPVVNCGELAESGGVGITEFSVPLESNGGILVLDFNPIGVPDKLEIIHNGVKVATTGMTTGNNGPFDNIYGDNLNVPNGQQVYSVDQFIGTDKGNIPNREAEILSETGLVVHSRKSQLIWWEYTDLDVITNPDVTIRVVGPTGTAWDFLRLCDDTYTTTTSSTTTTTTSSTTTTTTTSAPFTEVNISSSSDTVTNCSLALTTTKWVNSVGTISQGDVVFNDSGGVTLFNGNNRYYVVEDPVNSVNVSIQIDSEGVIQNTLTIC